MIGRMSLINKHWNDALKKDSVWERFIDKESENILKKESMKYKLKKEIVRYSLITIKFFVDNKKNKI